MSARSGEKAVRIWLAIAVGIVAIVFALFFFQFYDNSNAEFKFSEPDDDGYVAVEGYNGTKPTRLKIPSTDGKGNTVRYIAEAAFCGQKELEKVVIPNTVVEIRKDAFANAEELEEVVLPNKLEIIGRGAFANCTELDEIEFPETLRLIDDEAFYRCIDLGHLYIPASVTGIGHDAFLSCENLVLDVSDNQIASDVALEYNIETGKIDSTTIYLIVIIAIVVVVMAALVWGWHHFRHKAKMKKSQNEMIASKKEAEQVLPEDGKTDKTEE